jgi:hypothetical protein
MTGNNTTEREVSDEFTSRQTVRRTTLTSKDATTSKSSDQVVRPDDLK